MNPEPLVWRRLAAAILKRAALDARSGNGQAASARQWLLQETVDCAWCADLLDALDLDAGRVRGWVGDLPEVAQPALEL